MLQTLRHDGIESIRRRSRIQSILSHRPFLVHVADAVTEYIQLHRLLRGQALSAPVLSGDLLHHVPGIGVDEIVKGIDACGIEGPGEILPLFPRKRIQQEVEIPAHRICL